MPGLLARARLIEDRMPTRAAEHAEGTAKLDETGVSEEKRREMLAQIERLLARERRPVPAAAFHVGVRKHGIALPLVMNASLALLTLLVILGAAWFFRVRQERMSDEAASYLSTEGRLIDAIRRESEEKLRIKDAEIAGIQERLRALDRESEALRSGIDDRVQARGAELLAQAQGALDAERRRLVAQGIAAVEVGRRLDALALQKERERTRDLEAYRAGLAAEAQARESEIQAERGRALEDLRKADVERVILQESRKGVEETGAGFDPERQVLRDQVSSVEQRLRELEDTQRREQLVLDQILASYSKITEAISGSRYEEARQDLLRLRRYLTDPALDLLPAVARRKEVDLFLVAALQAVVAPEYFEAFRSREAMARLEEGVRRAAETAAAGNRAAAKALYAEALGRIAAVERAVTALREMELSERGALLRESVDRSAQDLARGDVAAAALEYRRMVDILPTEHREPFVEAVGNLERALAEREGRSIAAAEARLAEARAELERRVSQLELDAAARETLAREEGARREREAAEARVDALAKRLEDLARIETQTTAVAESVRAGSTRARALLSGASADVSRAGAALSDAFSSEAAARMMPGLSEVFSLLTSTLRVVARDAGYGEGYQAAMDDVVDYAAYVGGGEGSGSRDAARSRLIARVEDNPAFRSALGGLESIVATEESRGRLIEPSTRLLGSVASVSGDRIIVESLVKTGVAAGARVEVRRASTRGQEETVAHGAVESMAGARLTVMLDHGLSGVGSRPRVSDKVYVNVD